MASVSEGGMMGIWIVYEGVYFHDGDYINSMHATKLCAQKKCRSDGFKLNHKDNHFENDKELLWRRIELVNLDCKCWKPRKGKEGK